MSVDIKISPVNIFKWGGFEDWVNGTSSAPTEFTLSAGAVAQESTTIKEGTYSCKLTRSGTDVSLYHDLTAYSDYKGHKLTFSVWVYCGVSGRARIGLGDDVATTNSSYNTGSGWERLTVTRDIDKSATRIRIDCQVDTDGDAFFDSCLLVEGADDISILNNLVDISGWKPKNKYRSQISKVTRREGIKLPNYVLEQKTIQIKGMVVGSTPALYRDNMDAFQKVVNSNVINPNGDKELKDLYLFDDRVQEVYITNLSFDNIAAMRIAKFSLNFATVHPLYRYYQKTRSKNTISSDPETFTIQTSGNGITRPIIKVTNSSGSAITSLIIDNLTTNQSWSYVGSLADGDVLEVDTDELTVKNNGVEDLGNFTGDTAMFLFPGNNEIVVDGLSAGILEIDYYNRWF